MPHLIWKRNDTFKEENINSKFLKVKVCTENRASIQYSITQHLRSKMDAKQALHQALVGVASLEKKVQQKLKEEEELFNQFAKLKEEALEEEALDKKDMQRLRESMGDNVKRREKMARALDEMQRVVQEVVKVKSLLELSMEKVVEEEMKVTELPITLQGKLSAWPELNKLDTEEKINKMFKLLEDVVRILMIQV